MSRHKRCGAVEQAAHREKLRPGSFTPKFYQTSEDSVLIFYEVSTPFHFIKPIPKSDIKARQGIYKKSAHQFHNLDTILHRVVTNGVQQCRVGLKSKTC